jgi:hypothetical protein
MQKPSFKQNLKSLNQQSKIVLNTLPKNANTLHQKKSKISKSAIQNPFKYVTEKYKYLPSKEI